jgi:hypothetical protein
VAAQFIVRVITLKCQVSAELKKPRRVLASGLAEVSIRYVDVHSVEVRPVEHTEKFKAELEMDPLGNGRVLEQRCIPLDTGEARGLRSD